MIMLLSSIQQQIIVCQSPKQGKETDENTRKLEIRIIGMFCKKTFHFKFHAWFSVTCYFILNCLRILLAVSDYVKRLVFSVHFRQGLTDVVAVNFCTAENPGLTWWWVNDDMMRRVSVLLLEMDSKSNRDRQHKHASPVSIDPW